MNARKNALQTGFTLIELIIVILILGILVTVALPKFVNLGGNARYAKMQGIEGAMKSAVAIVHSAALVNNLADVATGAGGATVTMDGGAVVDLAYLYPDGTANGIPIAAGFDANTTAASNTDGLNVTIAGGTITIYPNSAQTPGSCTLTYTAASSTTGTTSAPTITFGTAPSGSTC